MPVFADIPLDRVVVIGTSCSGKTTFAADLARILKVPHTEMDGLHWRANWTPAPRDELKEATRAVIATDSWVVDGNYGAVGEMTWDRATAVIWLDYSFPVIARRALRRTVRRSLYREELWAGNRESWRMSFCSKNSVLLWIVKTYRPSRRRNRALFQQPQHQHLNFVTLRSPGQAARFLREVQSRLRIAPE